MTVNSHSERGTRPRLALFANLFARLKWSPDRDLNPDFSHPTDSCISNCSGGTSNLAPSNTLLSLVKVCGNRLHFQLFITLTSVERGGPIGIVEFRVPVRAL